MIIHMNKIIALSRRYSALAPRAASCKFIVHHRFSLLLS